MIHITFHLKNLDLILFTLFLCQFFHSFFYPMDQKYLSSILWAKNEMILDQ